MIILPGYHNSGLTHWQTYWQRSDRQSVRFAPSSWEQPRLDDWLAALDRTVAKTDSPVLVAHSLGCLLVSHWAARGGRCAGAFLVAVPDSHSPMFPAEASTFRDVPTAPLPFPAVCVVSADDPYGSVERAAFYAECWNTDLVVAGALGHINADSNLGAWEQGRALFESFRAGLTPV